MTTHKAIREALEAATKNGWQTHVADNDQLRALLADLDAKTEALQTIIDASDKGHAAIIGRHVAQARAALKGTP